MPASTAHFPRRAACLQVSWLVTDDRLNITWDETEGPPIGSVGAAGFGTKLLKSALTSFDGKTEIAFLKTGVHCTMQCRHTRELKSLLLRIERPDSPAIGALRNRVRVLLMTISGGAGSNRTLRTTDADFLSST